MILFDQSLRGRLGTLGRLGGILGLPMVVLLAISLVVPGWWVVASAVPVAAMLVSALAALGLVVVERVARRSWLERHSRCRAVRGKMPWPQTRRATRPKAPAGVTVVAGGFAGTATGGASEWARELLDAGGVPVFAVAATRSHRRLYGRLGFVACGAQHGAATPMIWLPPRTG